eukprot:3816889-Alexandrium_andersonii.AAC.1
MCIRDSTQPALAALLRCAPALKSRGIRACGPATCQRMVPALRLYTPATPSGPRELQPVGYPSVTRLQSRGQQWRRFIPGVPA